ncbi:MAG: ornithine--oxo-acid transaminase [bacterium]
MNTQDYINDYHKYSANNYHPLEVILSKGEGIWVWDIDGNKYMDCLSAYSAVNQGHRHPIIINALKKQADQMTLTSRAFHNDQMTGFLKQLCELTGMEMSLPMNTGAEAVETAIKAARKWGYDKKKVAPDKAEIIVCHDNFHGRTTTIVGFSSEPLYKDGYGPFTPGFKVIDYGNIEQLKNAITENTVAFMLEPIQGEAGIMVPPRGFLKQAYELCKENNVLFVLDEIQTGLGRTGKLFCYEHEDGVKPDMLILGKALGGGVYPVSAVTASKDVLGVFTPGSHGSTFGGNPLAAAVAKASLDVIVNEKLTENSYSLGNYMFEKLAAIKTDHVKEIRGKGLFIGIEIKKESGPARIFCEKLLKLGILAKETHEQVIRIAPPLIITKEEVDLILDSLEKVLA